ncbi:MAG: hypothetical protein ACOYN6_00365 [Ignavibacteria bacterium]
MKKLYSNIETRHFGLRRPDEIKTNIQKGSIFTEDILTTSSSINYEETKDVQKQEKLQRKINKSEKAKYKSKKYSMSLKEICDEIEFHFLQAVF